MRSEAPALDKSRRKYARPLEGRTRCELARAIPLVSRRSIVYLGSFRGLSAVDGGVADVLALDDIDDVFGDVGGVVADALEVFGDEDQFERGKNDAGIAHHVGKQFTENLIAVAIYLIVGGKDTLCEF